MKVFSCCGIRLDEFFSTQWRPVDSCITAVPSGHECCSVGAANCGPAGLIDMPLWDTLPRVVLKLAAALPTLMNGNSREIADLTQRSLSVRNLAHHLEKGIEIVFVDFGSSINAYFALYMESLALYAQMVVKAAEISYNTTLAAAVGIASWDYQSGSMKCYSQLNHTDNLISRLRYSAIYFGVRYNATMVPLQEKVALKFREVIHKKFIQVAVAETVYSLICCLRFGTTRAT